MFDWDYFDLAWFMGIIIGLIIIITASIGFWELAQYLYQHIEIRWLQ